MIEHIDTEMEVSTASIKISPIMTSRQVSADLSVPIPNDPLRMSSPITSSANVNVSGNFSFSNMSNDNNNGTNRTNWKRTPLSQQSSLVEAKITPRTRYHSPLQRGPRKGSHYGYHDRRRRDCDHNHNHNLSFEFSESINNNTNYDNENDENGSGMNRFANFRRTFMQDDTISTSVNISANTDNAQRHYTRVDNDDNNNNNRMFVCDIDAPSDERDEDESVYEILSMVEQQQQDYDQSHNLGENDDHDENEGRNEHNNSNSTVEGGGGEETEEQRMQREEEESLALARQLVAEEAMASYAESSNFLRQHANEYSEEDLRALEDLIAEEDPMADNHGDDDDEVMGAEEEHGSLDLSYEALLQLGERIGDVKSERWALKAHVEIAKLKTVSFDCRMAHGKDENDCSAKCLICQFQYQEGECIRVLPCKHRFHADCVDQWLLTKDHCPYCRQCITE